MFKMKLQFAILCEISSIEETYINICNECDE